MPPCSAKGDRPSTMSLDPDHPKLSWRSLELGMKYLWKQNYPFEEYLWNIYEICEISVKAKFIPLKKQIASSSSLHVLYILIKLTRADIYERIHHKTSLLVESDELFVQLELAVAMAGWHCRSTKYTNFNQSVKEKCKTILYYTRAFLLSRLNLKFVF